MNQRTRRTLCTTLMACSLAVGPVTAARAVNAPAAGPSGSECFVEAKAGDATKATVTGGGFAKAKGKVFLDQTDGDGGGTATVGDDGTFTSGEVPAGKYVAFQQGGPRVNCVGGQEAQDIVNQKLILSEQTRGTNEGWAQGRKLAKSGACDAKAEPRTPNLHGLAADSEAQKKAEEAYKNAYSASFGKAIDFYCHH
ncbi:hypothetical protein BX286_3330 [Streptomyces sp. 3211.6]|uniref:hypothetical protein n=1 Tax=Streptomyces TaxID=1883 RepID=UPI000CB6E39B|nr:MULTISPECIES: hypothetical protein [Streptomyces]RKT05335.1 hypothetical protein BX286_3330 [Streptomyces sp. 3211.6]RPF41256.1 hypothetical protein EDD96_5052 [Streptomyces sp. Ag109_G2-6]